MPYRGRLLFPLLAELQQLDTDATRAAGGYDPAWRTVTVTYAPDGTRTTNERYKTAIRLPCQIEPSRDNAQNSTPAGNIPASSIVLIFHFADLERASLIDPNGDPLLRVNDKFIALYTMNGGFVRRMNPELYATEILSGGLGLGGTRNLAVVTFKNTPQGIP